MLSARFGSKWMWVSWKENPLQTQVSKGKFPEHVGLGSIHSFGAILATVLDVPRQWVIQDYLGIGKLGQWNVCLTYFSFFHWFMVSVLGFQGRNHERHKEVTGIWSRRWCLHVSIFFYISGSWSIEGPSLKYISNKVKKVIKLIFILQHKRVRVIYKQCN